MKIYIIYCCCSFFPVLCLDLRIFKFLLHLQVTRNHHHHHHRRDHFLLLNARASKKEVTQTHRCHKFLSSTTFYSFSDRSRSLKQARQKHQRKREREASFFLDNNNNNLETIDDIKKLVHFMVPFVPRGVVGVFSFAYTMNHKHERKKNRTEKLMVLGPFEILGLF